MATATKAALERDIAEALLRLQLARSERNAKQAKVCEDRMNRLLEKLGGGTP